ncbi:MDR family MFS transporter [Georgenia wangjunii]|uniref:MDR family MFS transporter n=1 Tax=Georgenia wangjunii TaxID=3117730 RepID=UPI002F26BEDA
MSRDRSPEAPRARATGRFGGARRNPAEERRHREVMEVFSGLLLALFVAMLSATIVGNALPVIIADLEGNQLQYTWIVTASLLASTAATPIFGKLADLFDKKKLLLFAIALFAVGSLLAGMATSAGALIAFRVVQGVGMGAQMALVQTVIATIISPRERGRYNGYMGAVMAVATVSGPLIGGVIVDTPWLGWRWCYWSAIPFSLVAIVVLYRRLHVLPTTRRHPKIDYWGSALIILAVTLLLLWLSFAGSSFAWASWQTVAMVGGGIAAIVAFVLVELRVPEPVVPMWILTERTTALSVVASFSVGTVMFAAPVFLGQYFQIGRGYGPTESGLMMVPMMLGVFLASTIAGRLVSSRGTWKRYVVGGVTTMTVGVALLSTIDVSTPLWLLAIFLLLVGIGQGASMQNLVLAVQNTVRLENMGVASSTVAFFRSLGGAIGVQVLGALLAGHIATLLSGRMAEAGYPEASADGAGGGGALDLAALPPQVADIVRSSYGDGMDLIFVVMTGFNVIALVAVLLMRNSTLRSTVDIEVKKAVTDATGTPAGAPTPAGPGGGAGTTTAAADGASGGEPADHAPGTGPAGEEAGQRPGLPGTPPGSTPPA